MSKNINNLPYNQDPNMVGEFEVMKLDELHDKTFMSSQQDHAKVIITSKKRDEPIQYLSGNTVDYIEANYVDLSAEQLFEDVPGDKEYTCRAEIKEAPLEADPRTAKKENDASK